MSDATYNNQKVYRKQGGDEMVVEADGIFSFLDESFTGTLLRSLARRTKQVTITNQSTGSTVLSDFGGSSPPVLPSEYGLVIISATATMTNGSARLYSAKLGDELIITFASETASVQSLIIYASGHASGIAGAHLRGSALTPVSSINMHASSNSMPILILRAIEDGVWAIIHTDGNVTENLSA